jgi:hypothetical protein
VADDGHQDWNQFGVVGGTGALGLMGKVVFLWKPFQQAVEIVKDHPKAYVFVVFFKVLGEGFIKFFVSGLWASEGAPVVAEDLAVSDDGSIPLALLDFEVILQGLDVALKVNRLKVRGAGDCLNFLVVFPPPFKRKYFSFSWIEINSQNFLFVGVALFAGRAG